MPDPHAYPPIADYGIIGDCHTAVLVARDSSIDWFCPGRFDAPAVFCRLLDRQRGGYLSSAPIGAFSIERRYRAWTNVLETTLSSDGGKVRVTDLMPIHRRGAQQRGYDVGTSQRVLRLVEGLSGEVELGVEFKPTFDFGRCKTELSLVARRGVIAHGKHQYLTLACHDVELQEDDDHILRGRFRLRAGEQKWLVLTYAEDPDRAEEALAPVRPSAQLERTVAYWEHWANSCTYRGPYRDAVVRSALVLKLLTYEPTGALVAAPTTSLPEEIGGPRNWDYRYTWLRDSSLILYALMTVGYRNEAADFMEWLEHAVGSDPTRSPQIMYAIDGRRELPEHVLPNLEGYRGSRPVRIGNGAADQRQLDIYGEVLRAAYLHHSPPNAAPGSSSLDAEAWKVLRGLIERAAAEWTEEGRGIWEVRGGPQPFLYGKLMCWAALDAGINLAQEHELEAPVEEWQNTREQIRQAILDQGYDRELGAFTQAFGSRNLDASALIIPRIGFLPATDERVRSTLGRIRQQLTRDGLVYRYCTPDGLPGGEGTFTLCTFWLADALALSGDVDEARALFDRALGYANDLGLLAEEIDPESGHQLGNFPQGFSHMALIGAAVDIAKAATEGAEHRPRSEAERAGPAQRAAAGGS
jgi:alpha,alpha-trehalase